MATRAWVTTAVFVGLLPLALPAARGGTPQTSIGTGTTTCNSTVAARPQLRPPQPFAVVAALPSQPYAVTANGSWAFVSYPEGYHPGTGLISVLALHGSSAKLVRTEALSGEPFGLTLSPNGRFLLVANYLGGLEVLNAAALEAGKTPFVAAHLPARGTGSDEVVVTPNGRYAFVPEEESDAIAVYSLGELLSWPITKTGPPPKQLGSVPVGSSPSGIALARGGKTLYVVSQTPIHGPATAPGQLASISVSAAEQTPADAVIGTINAGCDPVRVALAPSGESAWVTDRGGNSLLGFKLSTGSRPRVGQLEAEVRVGPEPVDATFVDSGSIVLVTDSDRYGAPEKNQTVAVINVTDALAHRPSLVGYLPAGAFPRQFGQVPGGRILFTDYDSDDVRLIGSADLNWLRSQ